MRLSLSRPVGFSAETERVTHGSSSGRLPKPVDRTEVCAGVATSADPSPCRAVNPAAPRIDRITSLRLGLSGMKGQVGDAQRSSVPHIIVFHGWCRKLAFERAPSDLERTVLEGSFPFE